MAYAILVGALAWGSRQRPVRFREWTCAERSKHEPHALAEAIRSCRDCDLLVLIGASAISDRRDVLPVGIALAGCRVEHLGVPGEYGRGGRHALRAAPARA